MKVGETYQVLDSGWVTVIDVSNACHGNACLSDFLKWQTGLLDEDYTVVITKIENDIIQGEARCLAMPYGTPVPTGCIIQTDKAHFMKMCKLTEPEPPWTIEEVLLGHRITSSETLDGYSESF